MNPRRGWNPDLEGSYLPEYTEYEAESFTQGKSSIYIWSVKILSPDPASISGYSECTKTISFSILGFSGLGSN